MDNSKDNKLYIGQNKLPASMQGGSDTKSQNNVSIYDFINKKTEKLITALYMVTDCIDFDDALKTKLRSLGVELLSSMYRFSTLSIIEKHTHISTSISRVNETITFIDIASTIGFISEMNADILKREFNNLITELEEHLSEKQQLSFILDKEMFDIPRPIGEFKRTISIGHHIGQDKGQGLPPRPLGHPSFIRRGQNSNPVLSEEGVGGGDYRKERIAKIISLIKEKVDISIKDISTAFTDCSEKTIQRELNTLVLKGELKKTGSKRWSRYSIDNPPFLTHSS